MDVQKDFADLCSLLTVEGVEFPIVGGYAVGHHGAPRFTGDLDILIRPDARHVERMLRALTQFGFPAQEARCRLPSGAPEHPSTITGVLEKAWASRHLGSYGDVPVFFIGRQALIANQRATGRTKDLADVEALEPGEPS